MFKKVFFRGSALLAGTTAISYALGLWRDRLLAHAFGASQTLGAYEAAFVLPDLILNIFVAAGLSAAFVPIFNSFSEDTQPGESDTFVSSVLNGSLVCVIVFGGLAWLALPTLANWLVPGFDPITLALYIRLARWLLVSPIIFALSNTLGNILLSRESFAWYGISAALYNLGTILGVLLLADRYGITGVVMGTVGGAILHLLSRLIGLRKRFFRYRPRITWDVGYRRFLRIMTPKMLQHPIEELTFLGFTIIASTLASGSIVLLHFARNFQVAPINIIGVNLALAAFPAMSRLAASNDRLGLRKEIHFTLWTIFGITLVGAIAMYLLRHVVIGLLLGGGAAGPAAISATAATLGIFALSIPTESMTQVLARGFYAMKDSLTPVITSVLSLVLAVVAGYWFAHSYGVPGLALGFFTGSLLKTILLYLLLERKIAYLRVSK